MNRGPAYRLPWQAKSITPVKVLLSNSERFRGRARLSDVVRPKEYMGKLFDQAAKPDTLEKAWRRIRSNGWASSARETREALEDFDRTATRDLKRIRSRLRDGTFEFDPQKGVTKQKSSGGKRGIVMASVHNRIVERALLDVLQSKSEFVRTVIEQPTSIGGVPKRSVPHGLRIIRDEIAAGASHFVKCDISGFFDNIPRKHVIELLSREMDDQRFLNLLDQATTVTLSNERALGEDRKVFPTDEEGVAQGSPLSPLFGNILLNEFDKKLNGNGITCVRFIDDFLILGRSETKVRKAFGAAQRHLSGFGLSCHDPFLDGGDKEKAAAGNVGEGFIFLGYSCHPGRFQPSPTAKKKIRKAIDQHLSDGRWAIGEVQRANDSFVARNRYVQTLALVDRVLRGWGEAFAYGNAPGALEDLDRQIEEKLHSFRSWYAAKVKSMDWKARRRTGGVCLLSDIRSRSLDDVPFTLEGPGRFVRTAKTITISTDGAVISGGRRRGKDEGPGGWAFVVHGADVEHCGGECSTTNNRMELRAVIEAIRYVGEKVPIVIRTDSQYVSLAVNEQHVIKKNKDMWDEFSAASEGKKVRVVWVKGHSDDPHNERADLLARGEARKMRRSVAA